jgi:hypothetical protein
MTDLVGFERGAYGRAADRVGRIRDALLALALGTLVEDKSRPDAPVDQEAVLRRLAAAIAAILADPDASFTPEQLDAIMPLAPDLARLFQVAQFGGADFILRALGRLDGAIPKSVLARRLPLLALDNAIEWPPAFLSALSPREAQLTLAQLIANKPVMTMRGQKRRDALLDFAPALPPAEFPRSPDHLVLIASAWMLCSYAGTPNKHAIKRLFNATLRGMAVGWGFRDLDLPAARPRKPRPVLLFASEMMHSRHVQYRYFGQYLRQLRARFELVLLTDVKEVDPAAATLFDRVLTFDRSNRGYLAGIYRMIVDTAPDILFYPSVGMRHWGPLFANLRLAPIQLTALGHSASTFCDTIDYYLLEEGYVSDPALFGERVITLPDDSLIFERMPDYSPPEPRIRPAPATLRLVFPSNALKLNPGFLATIARIKAGTRRPLEFHFLPNARGLELAATRKLVQGYLPGAQVHPTMAYANYIEAISGGDLNLSPFPFGGLHSVIDSLRQGLPVVAMDCPEPHGRTDAMLLRRLGMPEWLIAKSEDDYVAAALRVIEDDGLRVALSEQALALDIGSLMFGDATTPLRSEVVDAMWWLYQNHEAVQADPRKLWSQADRNR